MLVASALACRVLDGPTMRIEIISSLTLTLSIACGAPAGDRGAPDAQPSPIDASAACTSPIPGELADSGWVFAATVVELHAATEPEPPIDPQGWDLGRMAIVRIDAVPVAPASAPLPLGQRDTIIFRDPPSFDVGYAGYFWVTDYLAGASWVFTEEGHMDASALPYDQFVARVQATARYNADEALYERMRDADAVVVATVTSAAELPGQPISDDLPDWWQATVTPTSTLRGTIATGPIAVRFDGSHSACCYRAPKLAVGQQAVLILYPDTMSQLPGDAYLVVDPLDVQAIGERDRMAALLASPPTCPSW